MMPTQNLHIAQRTLHYPLHKRARGPLATALPPPPTGPASVLYAAKALKL